MNSTLRGSCRRPSARGPNDDLVCRHAIPASALSTGDQFHRFTTALIGAGDDAALLDRGVFVHRGFDLRGPDLEARGVDHAFQAVGNEVVAVLVHAAEVASAKILFTFDFNP